MHSIRHKGKSYGVRKGEATQFRKMTPVEQNKFIHERFGGPAPAKAAPPITNSPGFFRNVFSDEVKTEDG